MVKAPEAHWHYPNFGGKSVNVNFVFLDVDQTSDSVKSGCGLLMSKRRTLLTACVMTLGLGSAGG